MNAKGTLWSCCNYYLNSNTCTDFRDDHVNICSRQEYRDFGQRWLKHEVASKTQRCCQDCILIFKQLRFDLPFVGRLNLKMYLYQSRSSNHAYYLRSEKEDTSTKRLPPKIVEMLLSTAVILHRFDLNTSTEECDSRILAFLEVVMDSATSHYPE